MYRSGFPYIVQLQESNLNQKRLHVNRTMFCFSCVQCICMLTKTENRFLTVYNKLIPSFWFGLHDVLCNFQNPRSLLYFAQFTGLKVKAFRSIYWLEGESFQFCLSKKSYSGIIDHDLIHL